MNKHAKERLGRLPAGALRDQIMCSVAHEQGAQSAQAKIAALVAALRDLSDAHEAGKQPPVRMWEAARAALKGAAHD